MKKFEYADLYLSSTEKKFVARFSSAIPDYEYSGKALSADYLVALNMMGEDGWELISNSSPFLFKREV